MFRNIILNQLNFQFLLKLKHNLYNKKMLGVLFNNIISKTIITCDEIDRYKINIIDIDDIDEWNKKNLFKKKNISYISKIMTRLNLNMYNLLKIINNNFIIIYNENTRQTSQKIK
nr:hypothetical protein [Megavirus caiporensis]